MTDGPVQRYRRLVTGGTIEPDPAQALAVEKLQLLSNRLSYYKPPSRTDFLSYFTRRRGEIPDGLYLYGGVGRGKTMLMDLFFETVPFAPKRRVHFHAFLQDVHLRIAKARASEDGDPIPEVARAIAAEAMLLCLDELIVTDIADAMILGRLFSGLFAEHVVMVATSNVPPQGLYKDGLNRDLFLPFVALIDDRMEVLELAADRDYRQDRLAGGRLYFTPNGERARAGLRAAWRRLSGLHAGAPQALDVQGRKLLAREAYRGVGWFGFADLCEAPLGPADYLAVAGAFHTVIVEGVPVLGPHARNAARRFITLIDTLYDARTRLIVSADAEPERLYLAGDGADHFARTASRLVEMRSDSYLAGRSGGPP